jgi:hypothetical protein
MKLVGKTERLAEHLTEAQATCGGTHTLPERARARTAMMCADTQVPSGRQQRGCEHASYRKPGNSCATYQTTHVLSTLWDIRGRHVNYILIQCFGAALRSGRPQMILHPTAYLVRGARQQDRRSYRKVSSKMREGSFSGASKLKMIKQTLKHA